MEDLSYVHTPDIAVEIEVANLPDDIMALFRPFQEYYSDAETREAEALTSLHQANLSEINLRISGIDDQIARLQSHREKLISKRDQESKNVAMLKSILSPIRRLPRDILCEIFVHCLPKTSNSRTINTLDAFEAPLLLCQVCSKWRMTALAFPPLWKALALRAGYAFHDESQFILAIHPSISAILDRWFARAGSCPLSLGFDLHEGDKYSGLTLELEDVLNQLPSSRLQHLSLKVIWPSDTFFLSKISQEFTNLESIFLQSNDGPDSVVAPDRLLQSAPRLHSAELHNFVHPETFPRYLLPWSQLTHLRVEDQLEEKMWYNIICLCTNLHQGVFSIDCDSLDPPPIPASSHDIILPHLVGLTVHITEHGDRPNFRQLVLPALRRLELLFDRSVTMGPPYLHWDGHFPVTDNGRLKSIIIIGLLEIGESQLQSLFNLSSSITELRLSVDTYYTAILNNLTLSLHSQPLLPKLEVLHCDIRENENHDPLLQSIVSFVQSRGWDKLNSPATHNIAQLQRLTVKFHTSDYEGDFMSRARHSLAPFGDQGLSLVVDTWDDDSLKLRDMMGFGPE